MNSNEYLLYNSIQDFVMYVGNNAVLKICLKLYKNKRNTREYYYDEYQYSDRNNYICRNINRNIDCYLVLDSFPDKETKEKESMILKGTDIELMKMMVIPHLESWVSNFNKLYEYRENNKLYLINYIKPIEVELFTKSLTGSSNKLKFELGIFKTYTEELFPCIDIYMNTEYTRTQLVAKSIFDFLYFMKTIQLQTYASTMLAYFEKPPEDVNLDAVYNQSMQTQSSGGFFNNELAKRKTK